MFARGVACLTHQSECRIVMSTDNGSNKKESIDTAMLQHDVKGELTWEAYLLFFFSLIPLAPGGSVNTAN